MVKCILGKEEFYEILCYFECQIEIQDVYFCFNICVEVDDLISQGFDEVVLVIGVVFWQIQLEGIDYFKVLSYVDVFLYNQEVGQCVVIIGVGGIGFDVFEFFIYFLLDILQLVEVFMEEWGVDIIY